MKYVQFRADTIEEAEDYVYLPPDGDPLVPARELVVHYKNGDKSKPVKATLYEGGHWHGTEYPVYLNDFLVLDGDTISVYGPSEFSKL